jgi:hypothetical protein
MHTAEVFVAALAARDHSLIAGVGREQRTTGVADRFESAASRRIAPTAA